MSYMQDPVEQELEAYEREQQMEKSVESAEKLTEWENEPSLLDLKGDHEGAKQHHDSHMQKIDRWLDLLNVTNSAKPKKVKGRSSVQPKLIRRQAEWRYSALTEAFLSSSKMVIVHAVTFEDVEGARQNELLLNWQFRTKMNKQKFIDDYVRAAVNQGTVVVRVGWERETYFEEKEVPEFVYQRLGPQDQEAAQMLQQALMIKQQNPREFEQAAPPELKAAVEHLLETNEPTIAIPTGEMMTIEEEVIVKNHPTASIINPKNVVFDPSCEGDTDKAMFAIYTFETNLAELRQSGIEYQNLDHVNIPSADKATETDHETKTPIDFNFKDEARRKLVAHEYWGFYDIHGDGTLVPIVATWIGNVLIRMEENPFPDQKIPFVVVPYMPVMNEIHGEPDAELLEDNQRVLGAVVRGMIDLMGRSANAQTGIAKGMLDPVNRRRYNAGRDYEFNPANRPDQQVIQHKYPELPKSAFDMIGLQNQDAEALSGVKSFAGGLSGEAYGDVASGIKGMLDASSKREMSILRRLAKGIRQIAQKFSSMNAEFLSEEEVIRVTNEEYVVVRREDILGEYDFETDISTAEMDNMRAQELGFILQTLGPNMDPRLSARVVAKIADLKKLPDLAEEMRNWEPQPDPMQQQLMQLQIEEQQMKNMKLGSEVGLNQAKTQETMASAQQKGLDVVEQETGTQHLREMEKTKAQSEGNMNLEMTKALLNPPKEGEKRPDIAGAFGFKQLVDALDDPLRRHNAG